MKRKLVKLLPKQKELFDDREASIIGYSGGYGSGKTYVACVWSVDRAVANWPAPVCVVEPTYRMMKDVFIPSLLQFLGSCRMRFEYLKSDYIVRFQARGPDGKLRWHKILCRSADNPRRLEGLNLSCALMDEFELCDEQAAKTLLGRLRHSLAKFYQLALVGTPEGFGWGYRWLEESPAKGTRLIRVRTADNTHLPKAYEDNMRASLSEAEQKEKLDGVRTRKEGVVYTKFSRDKHLKPAPKELNGEIEIWADFNFGKMVWCFALWFKELGIEKAHVFAECIGYDVTVQDHVETAKRALARLLSEAWGYEVLPQDVPRHSAIVIDASGASRNATVPITTVGVLSQAGFGRIKYHKHNPAIVDRVASLQKFLGDGRIFIDPKKAPYIVQCIENQPMGKNEEPYKDPDVKKGLDHGSDAVGYGVYMRWPAQKPGANRARH